MALPSQIKIGRSGLVIEPVRDRIDLPASALLKWVSNATTAVTLYYGQFPISRATLKIQIAGGEDGVLGGTTWDRGGSAFTRITLGQHTTEAQLNQDWTLTHEFIHMGFPSVPREHHWIEEGIATYVEPIARVQAGQLTAEKIWSDMVRSMPKGEPASFDKGLDNTHTWGRTYWGGALFCLLADVQIRERTDNHKGLQDALRAILKAGGNIEADWPITRAFQTGDSATGVPVLSELYDRMKAAPVQVDLPALWKRLGIELRGRSVIFDDSAPLAAVRRAITAAHPHA